MHVGSRDGSGADPSGPNLAAMPIHAKSGREWDPTRSQTYGPLGMATLDGGFVGRCGDTEEWDRRNRASSPESEEGALPLIDTDDADRERIKKGHRRGRRCHMRVAGTAIRKIEGVTRS